jgi:hypothetical protein
MPHIVLRNRIAVSRYHCGVRSASRRVYAFAAGFASAMASVGS